MAIGDRCQSAKTYLEKNYENFGGCGADELVSHALKAMRASAQDTELTEHNISVGVVGAGHDFKMLSKDEIRAALVASGDGDEGMIVS